jgi:general stress protein 26
MVTSRAEILSFMRRHTVAVQASVSAASSPQAAVVGFIVTDDFDVFFDTIDTSRKVANLRHNQRIALVIGGTADGEERTVQYEGLTDEPEGDELEQLKKRYLSRFPGGRDRQTWPGLIYVRVRPTWLRFSNFSQVPPEIVHLTFGPADDRRLNP